MSEEIVRVSNIEKSFGGVRVLDKVSLCINGGEIRCLAGENGCGKSTLIKIISGVYSHDAGEIALGGKIYPKLKPIDAIHKGIQVIYQDFSLFPQLSVAENLALNDQMESGSVFVNWKRMRKIAEESLAMIGVEMDTDMVVEDLPVSGKQLVAIARAVYCDAKLVIMDEPTTALTQKEVDSLFALIRKLRDEKGISTLFISHKMREMLDITEKITIMRNGKVVADGDTKNFDEAKITEAMTGRSIGAERFTWQGTNPEPLLKTEHLGKKGMFEDINFSLNHGEIVGITGLLGSGRTELALALFGKEPADTGKIFRDGKEVSITSIQNSIDNGIAYVPEDRLTEGLFLEQSIERNLFANTYKKFESFLKLLSMAKIRESGAETVKEYGIVTPNTNRPVRSLSGGNQQRVVLARWMSTGAKILILNGPTVGVDVGSKFEIHKRLREIAACGVGILIFSDDTQELVTNCNRIIVIHKGKFTGEMATKSLSEDELVERLVANK